MSRESPSLDEFFGVGAERAEAQALEESAPEKMFSFEIEFRGHPSRVDGWFSGTGPDDPCEFDIDAIWHGWTAANRGMSEEAGGPTPIDLSTLTDDEEEALIDAAFSAVAAMFPEPPADQS